MPSPIIADKNTVEQIFDGAAPIYDRVGPALFRRFGARLVELMNLAPGSRVLDIGTGAGAVLVPAGERVGPQGQVIGIDLSNEMIAQAAQAARDANLTNVQLSRMDAERLEFPDETFDAITAGFSIFFCPDVSAALKDIFRVAKSGARIGLSVWSKIPPPFDPAWKMFADQVRKYGVEIRMPQKVAYAAQEVQDMVANAGFKDVRVVTETADLVYAHEEDWWAFQTTMGTRAAIYSMPIDVRARFKEEYLAQLRPLQKADGLHLPAPVLYTFGERP